MASYPFTPRRIALFTDFGHQGPYLGQMKAVLEEAAVPVIDLQS
ncbi:MAG: SAM-dependent chlorinase/fluorinase, partial [Sedimenticola sp.]